jgi:hypothetical protein
MTGTLKNGTPMNLEDSMVTLDEIMKRLGVERRAKIEKHTQKLLDAARRYERKQAMRIRR